ncbi:MAG: NADH-quinone oxidoreductase subunit J, partial [Prevotella sp.]|nr:NADH-quinone oxidoreductase subunit J [Prevotella sp.]
MAEQIIFYILAVIIAGCSVLTVISQRIIRSAVFLLLALLATAGLYLLLDYQFLAAVQVAVYAGGVMVLFIFSILLTQQPGKDVAFEKPKRIIVAGLAALAGLGICGYIIFTNVFKVG